MKILVVVLLLVCCVGCFSSQEEDIQLFRNIFYTYAAKEGYVADVVEKWMFYPTEDLRNIVVDSSVSSIHDIERVFRKRVATELEEEGRKHPFSFIPDVDEPLKKRNRPLTIILFAGFFGEYITHYPFQELFESLSESSFAKLWRQKWSEASIDDQFDEVFNLLDLKYDNVSLKDIINVCSIDDEESKRPLVQFLYLRPRMSSFETFGTIKDNQKVFIRRIGKISRILGSPLEETVGDILLQGYSRTACDVLDLAVVARKDASIYESWGGLIRGVISLVGTHWGTPAVDCAYDIVNNIPGEECPFMSDATAYCDATASMLNAVVNLTNSLVPKMTHFIHNSELWVKALDGIVKAQGKMNVAYVKKNTENLKVIYPELRVTWDELVKRILFDQFDLLHPTTDYDDNVRRWLYAATKILDGIREMSSASRKKWFETNVIPSDYSLFAITSSQIDANISIGETVHTDTYLLRQQFYQLFLSSCGQQLNDAQVPTSREVHLPYLHASMNPEQKKEGLYNSYWFSVAGATHWGTAFPVAFVDPDLWVDSFPRSILLESVANFCARKL